MRLLVILPTLLTAAIAAKLPHFAQHHQNGVGATQGSAHTRTPELGATNGLTQTYDAPNEPRNPVPLNGQAGHNGLPQLYSAPDGPKDTISNGQVGLNGQTQTHIEPQDLAQTNGLAGQNGLTQTYDATNGPQDVIPFNGQAGQNGQTQTYTEAQDLTQTNGRAGQNGLTNTYSAPNGAHHATQLNGAQSIQFNGAQDLSQINGQAGLNGFAHAHDASKGPQAVTHSNGAQTQTQINGHEEQNGISHTYGAPNGAQGLNQVNGAHDTTHSNGHARQNGLTGTYHAPNGAHHETQLNGAQDLFPSNGRQGQTQFNGAQAQTQFNGAQGQTQFNGAQGQTQINGAQGQTKFNGAQAQTQFNGAQGQTQFNGAQGQTQFNGAQDQTQFNGAQGQTFNGAQGQTQLNGAQDQTQFNGAQGQTQFNGAQGQTQFNGLVRENGLPQTYSAPQDLIQSNGHSGQNGFTQNNNGFARPQDLTQNNGNAGQNGFIQSHGASNGPQDRTQSNGQKVASVFIPTFDETYGFSAQTQQHQGSTEQDTSLETHRERTVVNGQAQAPNALGVEFQTLDRPAGTLSPEEVQEATRSVLGKGDNGCSDGQVRHADGSCTTPEVTRSVYVFGVPKSHRPPPRSLPSLPPPKVHEHVLLIRAPDHWAATQRLMVPPPAQKSVVYVLRKENHDEELQVLEAPTTQPPNPEVFFVNYKEGDNLSLPNGLDLQQHLQGATTGPATVLDADREDTVAVDSRVRDFSGPSDDLTLEGQSDEELLVADYRDSDFTSGGIRDGTFVLEGRSDEDVSVVNGRTGGSIAVLKQRDDDVLEDYSDEVSLTRHINGGQPLNGNRNGRVNGFHSADFAVSVRGSDEFAVGFQSEEDLVRGGTSDEGFVLRHNGDDLARFPNGNTGFNVLTSGTPDYRLRGVEETLETFASQEVSDSSVFGAQPEQVEGDQTRMLPAQLLSVSTDGSLDSFSSSVETVAQSVEDILTPVHGGDSSRPRGSLPSRPALFYAPP